MRALLTGGAGMLGSSIAEAWGKRRPTEPLRVLTRADVDLTDRAGTARILADAQPDVVIHCAAVVGGIQAKLMHPAKYLLQNLLIDTSVIDGALAAGIPNLLYVSSAAIYPEHLRQPFLETDVLAAPLERANEGYAIAKIAGSKLCEYLSREHGVAYRVVVPSNLYGPADDHSLENGHLIAAAIGKLHAAKVGGAPTVSIWGDGTARREFTYSVDIAEFIVDACDRLDTWPALVNVGAGVDHSIADYYDIARSVVDYPGQFVFDTTRPAGMQRRLLDSSAAAALGWAPTTGLRAGMSTTYARFLRDASTGEPQ